MNSSRGVFKVTAHGEGWFCRGRRLSTSACLRPLAAPLEVLVDPRSPRTPITPPRHSITPVVLPVMFDEPLYLTHAPLQLLLSPYVFHYFISFHFLRIR